MLQDNTPVLVGVAQGVRRDLPSPISEAPHPLDFCAEVVLEALEDSAATGDLAGSIQSVQVVKMFADSTPLRSKGDGYSNNPPRSVARRIGADPEEAIYTTAGGDTPQRLINGMAERIARGELDCALLCGVEVLAAVKQAAREGVELAWREEVEGEFEDLGFGSSWWDEDQIAHRVLAPMHCYPLLENAVRGDRRSTVQEHLESMARLFAPFSEVAARNPFAFRQTSYSVDELSTPEGKNRVLAHPYPRLMNARDSVDQSAAVVMTSVAKARELGVPQERWVFLHGCADAQENGPLLDRSSFHRSAALKFLGERALAMAGLSMSDMSTIELYSCFPSAVEIAARELRLKEDDPRGLNVTGGLPFFGGPGNNYSMHGVAEVVGRCRQEPGSFAWVSANGGNLNKHSAGIYSTSPIDGVWQREDPRVVQRQIEAIETPTRVSSPRGAARVETCTVVFAGGEPSWAIVVGRTPDEERFLANVTEEDPESLRQLLGDDALELEGDVCSVDGKTTFRVV